MNKIFKVKRNAAGQSVVCSEIAKSRTKSRVVASALALAVSGLMVSGVAIASDVRGGVTVLPGTPLDTDNKNNIYGDSNRVRGSLNSVAGSDNVVGNANSWIESYEPFFFKYVKDAFPYPNKLEYYRPERSISNSYAFNNVLGSENILYSSGNKTGVTGLTHNATVGTNNIVTKSGNSVYGHYNISLADGAIVIGNNNQAYSEPKISYTYHADGIDEDVSGFYYQGLQALGFKIADGISQPEIQDVEKTRYVVGKILASSDAGFSDPLNLDLVADAITLNIVRGITGTQSTDAELASLFGWSNGYGDEVYEDAFRKSGFNWSTDSVIRDKLTSTALLLDAESPVVVGNNSYALGSGSLALGSGATAGLTQSVALGTYANADTDKGVQGYLADGNTDSTWQSTLAAVSIGDSEQGYTRQLTGLAAGTKDTDAVNIAQLKVIKDLVDTKADKSYVDAELAKKADKSDLEALKVEIGNTIQPALDGKADKSYVDAQDAHLQAELNKGFNVKADKGDAQNYKLGDTVGILGSTNIETEMKDGNVVVSLKDDISVNSVNVGTVSITKTEGINAGGKTITNVADGRIAADSTDAVNGRQMAALASDMYGKLGYTNNRIDQVDREAKAGIASAMAFEQAPMIPGKWTYAVGMAHYGGEQAAAVSFKKTSDNGRWSFSGGVSHATEGDTGFRVGVTGVLN